MSARALTEPSETTAAAMAAAVIAGPELEKQGFSWHRAYSRLLRHGGAVSPSRFIAPHSGFCRGALHKDELTGVLRHFTHMGR